MLNEVAEFTKTVAIQGDTFDMLSYRLYGEERMSKYLKAYNRNFTHFLTFKGGEELVVPVFSQKESPETLPPWRR